MSRLPGKIITFYSYKGGTGRSMALANVAWVLASSGKRVLTLDWDLEAPGLHRYFYPFLVDRDLTSSEGLIDFVLRFAAAAVKPEPSEPGEDDRDWYKPYANILRHASSLEWNFKGDGCLDLIPAGRQGPSYSTRVNSFNWQHFYDRLGGGVLLEMAKERMRAEYDYILIDSRTGVSDTSGICTVQMPDTLVVCFTLNNQSIEGAGAVAESVAAQRRDASGLSNLRIFPVPTRVEKFEKEKLELAREAAQSRFGELLGHLAPEARPRYWGEVEMFYEPFYAYEEVLATFGDKPNQTNSLLASAERLAGHLSDGEVNRLEPVAESDRQMVLGKYARHARPRAAAPTSVPAREYLFYLSHSHKDEVEYVEKFFHDLSGEVRVMEGLDPSVEVGFFEVGVKKGPDRDEMRSRGLAHSRVLVPLFSPAYFNSEHCGREFQYFLERSDEAARGSVETTTLNILPIDWIPTRGRMPEVAARVTRFSPSDGLRRIIRATNRTDEYRNLLTYVAEQIVNAAESQPPLPSHPPIFETLGNPFKKSPGSSQRHLTEPEAGPRIIYFVYAVASKEEMEGVRKFTWVYADRSEDWRPFSVDPLRARSTEEATGSPGYVKEFGQKIAAAENMLYRTLPFDKNLPSRVKEAEREGSPVVLVVDPWLTLLPRYASILTEFDYSKSLNRVIVVAWDFDDVEAKGKTRLLFDQLSSVFKISGLGGIRIAGFDSELVAEVTKALPGIRARLASHGNRIK